MKYWIVTEFDDCALSNLVCLWIGHGWKPMGGVSTVLLPPKGLGSLTRTPEHYVGIQYMQTLVHDGDDPTYPGME
jgi:hypothetical protein